MDSIHAATKKISPINNPGSFYSSPFEILQLNPGQGWQAFCSDWPRFVGEAGTVLYQDLPEVDGLSISTQTDVTLKHLESVSQRVARMDRNKMVINFEVAAMHLSLLLKGQDYPNTVAELAVLHSL